jgi:hypothetical protein
MTLPALQGCGEFEVERAGNLSEATALGTVVVVGFIPVDCCGLQADPLGELSLREVRCNASVNQHWSESAQVLDWDFIGGGQCVEVSFELCDVGAGLRDHKAPADGILPSGFKIGGPVDELVEQGHSDLVLVEGDSSKLALRIRR